MNPLTALCPVLVLWLATFTFAAQQPPPPPDQASDATAQQQQPPADPEPAQQPQRRPAQRPADQAPRDRAAQQPPAPRTQPGRSDRISEAIRNLDPEVLNRLLGAEVQVEFVGGQVVIKGPEEAVRTLEAIIRALDVQAEAERPVVKVVTVEERDAKEIARTVQEALRQAIGTPNQLENQRVTLTALTSNILLVSAQPRDIDFVLEVIDSVDAIQDPLGRVELMRFEVKNRKASDVAKELTRVLEQIQKAQGKTADKSKLQIIPNNSSNTITITARESEREKIQSLIDEIDIAPSKGWGELRLVVFPLIHSTAAELAQVITDLLSAQANPQDKEAVAEIISRLNITRVTPDGVITPLAPIELERNLKIIPDDGSNSLIIATIEENIVPLGELIRLLDGVPMSEDVDVRLFPLRFADAETVGETLTEMFDEGKELPPDPDGSGDGAVPPSPRGEALVYNVAIVADVRTNTLIVAGRPEQIALADTVVKELDRPASALKFPLRIITLQNSDVVRIGEIINDLFEKRVEAAEATDSGAAAVERERVFLAVDFRANAIIVSASEENFDEIAAIVRQLDVPPDRIFEQIRVIPLDRLAAEDMKTKIDELWKRKIDLANQAEQLADTPIIVADERSNSLVVASSIEDYEEIRRLVDTLETRPLVEDIRLFQLEFADAAVLAGMLDELFEGMAGASETFEAPTILPDPRSNTLVVAAARDGMERVAQLVQRLDVLGGPQTAVIRVYPLVNASAARLAQRMQQLFENRVEGEQAERTPVVVLADETSNSVVVSASRDDHAVVQDLLAALDRPSSISRQFEIFPLKTAKAATVAEKLEALFASQAEEGAGRADVIAVQADERTNSLIVWAAPSEMENIANIVDRLDTSAPVVEMMVRVIQLKQALAEDFATLLQETIIGEGEGDDERAVIISFLEKDAEGREIVRRLLRQDIRIQPDPRTNSLMVMAPADSMGLLEAMIRDFDKIRPIRSEIRIFPLVNSDAETLVDRLNEIFSPEGGTGAEGETRRQFNFGDALSPDDVAAVGQELRFSADARTNSIIAAGAEVDLRMVEDLVRFLDLQEAEDRVVEVYPAKFRDATEIATAVKNFVQQEQEVLGESEDTESRLIRSQRQVSIESLGDPEEGSSNLIVGTSRQNYQRTMDMITQLDRPEPQVMISVLIAEVTLNNDVELGVEFAGQQLAFSESAFLGPNGIVQGSDFDFVGGTDIGAAGQGLGGFNFTVTGEDFAFLLHALQTDSRLELLSRPILMVRNGEEGKITIADDVPIVESSQINDTGSTNSTIGREEVGIILTATPHISPDGYVTIKMTQEISNISGENVQLTEGVSSPVFSTREVDTNVTVRDGETVVIGGLIQTRDSEGENKVPLLGDIPGLGFLFRSTNVTHSKTELMVVLTVDILRTDEDVRDMSVKQRDMYELPEAIRTSPMMEGLRILPQDAALGPKPVTEPGSPAPAIVPPNGEQFGPRPRSYGPPVSRPSSTNTVLNVPAEPTGPADLKTYGPTIVRAGPTPGSD